MGDSCPCALGFPYADPYTHLLGERQRSDRTQLSVPPAESTRKPLGNLVLSVSLEPDLATPSSPSWLASKGYTVPIGDQKGLLKTAGLFF